MARGKGLAEPALEPEVRFTVPTFKKNAKWFRPITPVLGDETDNLSKIFRGGAHVYVGVLTPL